MTNDDCSLLLDYLADDLTTDELDALLRRVQAARARVGKWWWSSGVRRGLVEWARAVGPNDRSAVRGDSIQCARRTCNRAAGALNRPRRVLVLLSACCAVAASMLIAFG